MGVSGVTKRIFNLVHAEARRRAVEAVQQAPDGYSVTVSESTRTTAENNLLHALISEISDKLKWDGKNRDIETWKRLLVASWCRVRGESIEVLRALDGHGVDIVPARTSKLSKKECADLIEFVFAWGAEQGIAWSDSRA